MRVSSSVGMMVGSSLLYFVMAACGAGGGDNHPAATGPTGEADTVDAADREGGEVATDAMGDLRDALLHPVPDARAQQTDSGATGPNVQIVACLDTGMPAGGGGHILAATQAYPGKSVIELSAVRALATGSPNPTVNDTWLTVAQVYISPGVLSVRCGSTSFSEIGSVMFVLP